MNKAPCRSCVNCNQKKVHHKAESSPYWLGARSRHLLPRFCSLLDIPLQGKERLCFCVEIGGHRLETSANKCCRPYTFQLRNSVKEQIVEDRIMDEHLLQDRFLFLSSCKSKVMPRRPEFLPACNPPDHILIQQVDLVSVGPLLGIYACRVYHA